MRHNRKEVNNLHSPNTKVTRSTKVYTIVSKIDKSLRSQSHQIQRSKQGQTSPSKVTHHVVLACVPCTLVLLFTVNWHMPGQTPLRIEQDILTALMIEVRHPLHTTGFTSLEVCLHCKKVPKNITSILSQASNKILLLTFEGTTVQLLCR